MNKIHKIRLAACILAAIVFFNPPVARAGTFYWNGSAGNDYTTPDSWGPPDGPGVPGAVDLAVVDDEFAPYLLITSDVAADSLRLNRGVVNQWGGQLTIASGPGFENGLRVGDAGGMGSTTYFLSGGTIQVDDGFEGLVVGRCVGSQGFFGFQNGTVNVPGETHIGLDGNADWYQNGGLLNGGIVHIGRFQSPVATVTLMGSATWSVSTVSMSEFGNFNPGAFQTDLNIVGPGVGFNVFGGVFSMTDKANLSFDGQAAGVSTIHLNGGELRLYNGELFLNNLPIPSLPGETLVLVDGIGFFSGDDAQFDNAPQDTLFGDWKIDYSDPTQIRLVNAVPEPSSLALGGLGSLALALRKRFKQCAGWTPAKVQANELHQNRIVPCDLIAHV